MPNSKPKLRLIDDVQARIKQRMQTGFYESERDVIDAAFEALERRDVAAEEAIRRKIQVSLDDSRPEIPMEKVFERIERRHVERMKSARRDG